MTARNEAKVTTYDRHTPPPVGEGGSPTHNHLPIPPRGGACAKKGVSELDRMEPVFTKLKRFFGEFEFAVLRTDGDTSRRWIVEAKPSSIGYLKSQNAQGHHIFLRPTDSLEPFFMMIDDIDQSRLESDHKTEGKWKSGRMCVETSPGNFQVWVRSRRALSIEEKRHWLRLLGSDPGADPNGRWGRCPGFRNRKEKHRDEHGGYPLAKLIWVDWNGQADVPEVSLLASKVERRLTLTPPVTIAQRVDELSRHQYDKGGESQTDFAYALALMRRGASDEEVMHRIFSERDDWSNHAGERKIRAYLKRTATRARKLFEGG